MFIIIAACLVAVARSELVQDTRFTKSSDCPNQVMTFDNMYQTMTARSTLECISLCRQDERCKSVTYDTSAGICHLGNTVAAKDCSNMVPSETSLKYYETNTVSCQNGAVQYPNGSCGCVDSFVGERCEKHIEDCDDGFRSGVFTTNGIYTIKPVNSPAPFQVLCQMMVRQRRTVVLQRQKTKTNFNRTWQEYRDGFGDVTKDYFIGLQKLHELTTSRNYEMRFRVRLGNKTNYYKFYDGFVVNDESQGYSFGYNYTHYIQDLGDCLKDLKGAKFSTYDNDNDGDNSVNCGQQNGGGWWFSGANCSSCNPLGLILEPFDGMKKGVPGEAFWDGVLGDILPFTFMMYVV